MIKSVLMRFLKGAIAGAAASMALVKYTTPTTWGDFNGILNALGIAMVGGFLTGFVLAFEKWASWKE